MVGNILRFLSGLVAIVNYVLDRLLEAKIKKQVEDEIALSTLEADKKASQRADEISKSNRDTDLSALQQRMSKYARDRPVP